MPLSHPVPRPAPSAVRRRHLLLFLLLPLAAAVLLLAGGARGWLPWAAAPVAAAHAADSVGLAAYQVRIEALPLAGLAADVSGLTYDPDRNSLFAITNKQPEIVELSLAGVVLRRIPLHGLADPEAIEYVGRGHYVVTDERRQAIVEIRIADDTRSIDASASRQLAIGIGANGNKGFEGLAYDRRGDRLFVAKEKDPVRIYEIGGFPALAGAPVRPLTLAERPVRDAALPVRDLSSLYWDERGARLLVLSDDSKAVVEVDDDGQALDRLTLRSGHHGLAADVPQAEGMAMDAAGKLYLVSEPNLFYVFERRD
ncbi:MAG TPA: SdiA-regulated domain-containing protein [Azonexus sp.]